MPVLSCGTRSPTRPCALSLCARAPTRRQASIYTVTVLYSTRISAASFILNEVTKRASAIQYRQPDRVWAHPPILHPSTLYPLSRRRLHCQKWDRRRWLSVPGCPPAAPPCASVYPHVSPSVPNDHPITALICPECTHYSILLPQRWHMPDIHLLPSPLESLLVTKWPKRNTIQTFSLALPGSQKSLPETVPQKHCPSVTTV